MPRLDFAICILFFERPAQTAECVRSFASAGRPIYVLNNGSSARSRAQFLAAVGDVPGLIFAESAKNLGVARGRNRQLAESREPWLLFVDSDIRVETPDWHERLAEAVAAHPRGEVFAPRLYQVAEGVPRDCHRLQVEANGAYRILPAAPGEETNLFSGGASLVSRALFQRLGIYDERLFIGFEDVELCLRGIKKREPARVWGVPEVVLRHDHRPATSSEDRRAVRVRYHPWTILRSHLSFTRKHRLARDFGWVAWISRQRRLMLERPPAQGQPLTLLMPCHKQKEVWLVEAIESVLRQTDGHWLLDIIVEETSDDVRAVVRRYAADQRIRVLTLAGTGFARNLNLGLRECRTDFASFLFSDDRLPPDAVAVWRQALAKFPRVDVFYGGRRAINAEGKAISAVRHPNRRVRRRDFARHGSPVKHPLCVRVALAREVGGIDERFSRHAADDYDFPWQLVEAGAKFRAVDHCLYDYRIHAETDRLTTGVSIAEQLSILEAIHRKHRVPASLTAEFLQNARRGALLGDNLGIFAAGAALVPLAQPPVAAARGADKALPFVSVLVTSPREKIDLAPARAALSRQTYPADRFEVSVVEGDPAAAARNAKGEVVAFIDGKLLATPSWLRESAQRWLASDRRQAVAGQVLALQDEPISVEPPRLVAKQALAAQPIHEPRAIALLPGRRPRRKALLFIDSFRLGGAEKQAVVLARELRERHDVEAEVWALGKSGEGPVAELARSLGIPCRALGSFRWRPFLFLPWNTLRALWLIRRFAPDVIYSYTSTPNSICGVLWRLTRARTHVWSQRDEGFLPVRWSLRWGARWTHKFIVNSEGGARFLQEKLGVPAPRIKLVANGIFLAEAKATRAQWRGRLQVDERALLVVSLANLRKEKDHATLLRAWHRCSLPNALLLLAGDEQESGAYCRELVKELGLEDRVRFLGFVDDVAGLLAAADLAVLASNSEGMPNALLESMLAGLPAVATDIAAVRAIVPQASAPFLYPPRDEKALAEKLRQLAQDPAARAALGRANREHARARFSPEAMAKESWGFACT